MAPQLIEAKGVSPDPVILKTLKPWQTRVDLRMKQVIGEASAAFPRRMETTDSPLCNLVADAMRAKTGTQIAITNVGGIRTDLPVGSVTFGKIFEILPFENTLITLQLTGTQLRQSLGQLTAVSGLRVVWDRSKPETERLQSVTLADGSDLQANVLYTVTANDFMLAGGDNYTEIAKGFKIQDTGVGYRDAVVEYIVARKSISPIVDGRIRLLR